MNPSAYFIRSKIISFILNIKGRNELLVLEFSLPPSLSGRLYIEKEFQKIIWIVLKPQHPTPVLSALSRTRKRSLKTRVLDVHYDKSHMKCYNFCQQYKDHFAIAEATG